LCSAPGAVRPLTCGRAHAEVSNGLLATPSQPAGRMRSAIVARRAATARAVPTACPACSPARPMPRAAPAEPMANKEPLDPIDRIDPDDPIDKTDPDDPIDSSEPADKAEPNENADATEAPDRTEPHERHESSDDEPDDIQERTTTPNLSVANWVRCRPLGWPALPIRAARAGPARRRRPRSG